MRSRSLLAPLSLLALTALVLTAGACSTKVVPAEEPSRPLQDLPYNPTFPPEVNSLAPRPGVEVATAAERDFAVVTPDALEFPADKAASVRDWQPGRIVASERSAAGTNPLGYARRVKAVREENGKLLVETEPATLADLVSGELRVRVDDKDGTELDLAGLDPEWVKSMLYSPIPIEDPGFAPLKWDPSLSEAPPAPPAEGAPAGTTMGAAARGDWPGLNPFHAGAPQGAPRVSPQCCGFDEFVSGVSGLADTASASVRRAMDELSDVTVKGSYTGDGVAVAASISTKQLQAAGRFTKEVKLLDIDHDVFKNWKWEKTIERAKMTIFMGGNLKILASATFNPGFQLTAFVPFEEERKEDTSLGVAVNAKATTQLKLVGDLEVGIKSADVNGSKYGTEQLREAVDKGVEAAEQAMVSFRENVFGNRDVKPEGTVTKTLWISKPKTFTIQAGPVPVVITSTLQFDLICSFEAKAKLSYDLTLDQTATLAFAADLKPFAQRTQDRLTMAGPEFAYDKTFTKEILGGGELTVSCGLAPRVNVLLYDTAGINFGFRGSLKGKLEYTSKCQDKTTTPKADLDLGLYFNYGVRVGGRLQAPGSSLAGKKGLEAGLDIGPFEPWNDEIELKKWSWEFDKGIGYCTPLCINKQLNDAAASSKGKETDVDCGGGSCDACALGKKCKSAMDCAGSNVTCSAAGVCETGTCANGVEDGSETGIDCGGSCAPCAVGEGCRSPADCASGACNYRTGRCVATECEDGRRSENEAGTDCGVVCPTRCAAGTVSSRGVDCASGFSNGYVCVDSPCQDGQKSATETDVDCGGPICEWRCSLWQGCNGDEDCAGGYRCLDFQAANVPFGYYEGRPAPPRVCARVPDASCGDRLRNQDETDIDCGGNRCLTRCADFATCGVNADCRSLRCLGGRCQPALCTDLIRNGTETDTDCGGSACARCTAGKICNGPMDCQSGVCQAGKCAGRFTLGGSVAGLPPGTSVLLVRNGAPPQAFGEGPFTFAEPLLEGTPYDVTVLQAPADFTCTVAGGQGTMGAEAVTSVVVTCVKTTYAIGGLVQTASGPVVVQLNGGEALEVAPFSTFVFTTKLEPGTPFMVTVATPPPGQTCTVTDGSGTMPSGDVTSVSVSCMPITYTVGGTVVGATGALQLGMNGETKNVAGSGAFTFATPITVGSAYSVSVVTPPSGQTCTVENGEGTNVSSDVTNVVVTCTTLTYSVGGTITGATGSLTLENNGTDTLNPAGNGSFTFGTALAPGASYAVTVATPPPGQTCTVSKGAGTMGSANVTDVAISCTTLTYSVGGTVTGATGSLTLKNNGTDTLTPAGNGSFTFGTKLAPGASYAVTVTTPPPGQTCTVNKGAGTMGSANVTDVAISCASNAGSKRIFVTSATTNGAMGGVFGGDGKCQTAANAAGYSGTYLAWLSDSGAAPASRFTQANVPYKRPDGVQVAASWAALTSGTLDAPINVTETGSTYSGGVWTSTNANGTFVGSVSCNGWTSLASNVTGLNGDSTRTDGTWSYAGGIFCNTQFALYCVEQ